MQLRQVVCRKGEVLTRGRNLQVINSRFMVEVYSIFYIYQISSLGHPYTKCETDDEAGMKYFSHYSLQACRIECETDVIVGECDCRLAEQPGDVAICNPKKTHECAHPLLSK